MTRETVIVALQLLGWEPVPVPDGFAACGFAACGFLLVNRQVPARNFAQSHLAAVIWFNQGERKLAQRDWSWAVRDLESCPWRECTVPLAYLEAALELASNE